MFKIGKECQNYGLGGFGVLTITKRSSPAVEVGQNLGLLLIL